MKRMPNASTLSRRSGNGTKLARLQRAQAWLWISVAASIWPAASAAGRLGAWISTC